MRRQLAALAALMILASCSSTPLDASSRTTVAKIRDITVRKTGMILPRGPYFCERTYRYTDGTKFVEKYQSNSKTCR
jgi:hypothetical protein